MRSAKEESKSPGEMEAKVAMVDNLVNLFIQGSSSFVWSTFIFVYLVIHRLNITGNAVRAQKAQSSMKKKPMVNPAEQKTKKIIEKLKKELSEDKPTVRIKPSRDSKRILIEKSKNRPNNYRDRTNGLRPPIRLHRPKTVQDDDILEAPVK